MNSANYWSVFVLFKQLLPLFWQVTLPTLSTALLIGSGHLLLVGPSGVTVRARLYVVFLGKGLPLPAKHALIRTRAVAPSVTELTAWPTGSPETAS